MSVWSIIRNINIDKNIHKNLLNGAHTATWPMVSYGVAAMLPMRFSTVFCYVGRRRSVCVCGNGSAVVVVTPNSHGACHQAEGTVLVWWRDIGVAQTSEPLQLSKGKQPIEPINLPSCIICPFIFPKCKSYSTLSIADQLLLIDQHQSHRLVRYGTTNESHVLTKHDMIWHMTQDMRACLNPMTHPYFEPVYR